MKEFTLTLNEVETNIVIQALVSQPFKDVFQVLPKIQQQCQAQLQLPVPLVGDSAGPAA